MEPHTRQPLIAGNWKMHGSHTFAESLTGAIAQSLSRPRADIALIPPFPYLSAVVSVLRQRGAPIAVGAQDISIHAEGAHTGDISGAMLSDCGCHYVLVGHSERRQDHGETNIEVAQKFVAAQQAGLVPIVCVGETLADREAGQTDAVVLAQLEAVLELAGVEAFEDAVIAYEPVWAIGTGKTATPEQAQAVHASIRARIRANSDTIAGQVRVIYGGSVKPENAPEILSCEDIDGGLIGGASLSAESFLGICQAVL